MGIEHVKRASEKSTTMDTGTVDEKVCEWSV
jgi:hypothetical protein